MCGDNKRFMKNEKEIEAKELTDEQANEAAGGKLLNLTEKCYQCKKQRRFTDISNVAIDGVIRRVCKYCIPNIKKQT